jgi:16S rRNA (guanine1207-N2)-methyltransferase
MKILMTHYKPSINLVFILTKDLLKVKIVLSFKGENLVNHYFSNNEKLKSEIRLLKYTYGEYTLMFNSDLGVFAKDSIDEGSRTLLETYFTHGRKSVSVLDVGSGYGFLGISLAKIMDCNVSMIDVNDRALHLTKMNLKENKVEANVFKSNVYESVNEKFDVIISNPPIKAGKEVYLKIIDDAFNYLNKGGQLWFVMRTNHGVKTVYKNLKNKVNTEIMIRNKGFYVICCQI